jgi:integrase
VPFCGNEVLIDFVQIRPRARPISFRELADDAVEHSKAENGERSTQELILKFDVLKTVFGGWIAEEISKQDVVRWLVTAATDRDWAPATKNRWQAAISLAYRVGIENEKVDKNPAARIGRTRQDNGRVRWLSDEEEMKIREALERLSPQYAPAFDLSVHTGTRAGEQFSMQWSQVDWDRCLLLLPRTKNGGSRHVPLNAVALRALKQLKRRHGEISPNALWVHLNENGEKLRGHRNWFERALKDAGVSSYSWHCNRHTFASRLVMAGADLRTGELLGHRTPNMTWRYSHLAPAHQQRAVDLLVAPAQSSKKKSPTATGKKSPNRKVRAFRG